MRNKPRMLLLIASALTTLAVGISYAYGLRKTNGDGNAPVAAVDPAPASFCFGNPVFWPPRRRPGSMKPRQIVDDCDWPKN
jgi:hypothetical protein